MNKLNQLAESWGKFGPFGDGVWGQWAKEKVKRVNYEMMESEHMLRPRHSFRNPSPPSCLGCSIAQVTLNSPTTLNKTFEKFSGADVWEKIRFVLVI